RRRSTGLRTNPPTHPSSPPASNLAAAPTPHAAPTPLDSYTAERAPVAKQIVTRANQSAREFGALFEALGVEPDQSPDEMYDAIESRKENTAEGAKKRAAVREAMELKNYEFNAHGVEMGQFYTSDAIASDGTERPAPTRDPELYYEPSTTPGARLPHVWVGDALHKYSTHDLANYTQFTLFTGITGGAWVDATEVVSKEL